MSSFQNPPDEEIRELLLRVRNIAVVGLLPRTARPSHRVAAHMQRFGYRILPARPAVDAVLGEKAYASSREVPDRIVDECLELALPALWLQLEVVNVPAAERARAAPVTAARFTVYLAHGNR